LVVISIITTLIAAVVMATSVRVVALLNSIGVVLELLVLLGAAVGLLLHTHQSISVLANTGGVVRADRPGRRRPGGARAGRAVVRPGE
jgi:hypothetical protein